MMNESSGLFVDGKLGIRDARRLTSHDYAVLVVRVWIGVMLMKHGWPKIFGGIDKLTTTVSTMGFPSPELFAWAAAVSEVLGGFLLVVGLAVRPAALFASITMAVAAFIRHAADPFAKKELALTFLAILIFLSIVGSGGIGIDAMIRSRRRSSRQAA